MLAWLQDVRTFCRDPENREILEKIHEARERIKALKKVA